MLIAADETIEEKNETNEQLQERRESILSSVDVSKNITTINYKSLYYYYFI